MLQWFVQLTKFYDHILLIATFSKKTDMNNNQGNMNRRADNAFKTLIHSTSKVKLSSAL